MVTIGGKCHTLDEVGVVLTELGIEFEWWAVVKDDCSVVRCSSCSIGSYRANRNAVDGIGVS